MWRQSAVVLRAEALQSDSGAEATQRDWASAVEIPLTGLNIQPVDSDEVADSAAIDFVQRYMLHNAPGDGKLNLLRTDRIVYDGTTYEVDGKVMHWPHPAGGWHHTEAYLVEESLIRSGAAGSAASAVRVAGTGAASRRWSP
jgi:hypothetical protein